MTARATRQRALTAAQEALTAALVDLLDVGLRPVCAEPGGHELWCSEDPDDRATAAAWCLRGCPILAECEAAATAARESFGVWAGVDRTRPEGGCRR